MACGNKPSAFLRNDSSLFETYIYGCQKNYDFQRKNPIRFKREITVTIEHGHSNHLAKAMGRTACWYVDQPVPGRQISPVSKRMPFLRDNLGNWLYNPECQITSRVVEPNEDMAAMKRRWQER